MVALMLRFVLPLALLIQHAGATCVFSWLDSSGSSLGLCDTCWGSCDPNNGCYCVDGFSPCLPSLSFPCIDFSDYTLCCPPGLYYNGPEKCCTETPMCWPDCATDEVCDMGTCVCNSNLYQDKTHADFRPVGSCGLNVMSVTASKCLLLSLGYDEMSIRFNDFLKDCNYFYFSITNGVRVITLHALSIPGWCGNTVTDDGLRSYVTNSITIHAMSNSSAAINPINFTITCPPYTETDPNTQTVVINGVNGMDLYPLTMTAYKDPEFLSPYEHNDKVNESDIYVALYVYYKDRDIYVLRLQDCAASPTSDRSNMKALRLISEGCAANNLTRIIQNGISSEVRMEISLLQLLDFATIHLFCDARLCMKNGEECNMCKESQYFSMGVTELRLDLQIGVLVLHNTSDADAMWEPHEFGYEGFLPPLLQCQQYVLSEGSQLVSLIEEKETLLFFHNQ